MVAGVDYWDLRLIYHLARCPSEVIPILEIGVEELLAPGAGYSNPAQLLSCLGKGGLR